MSRLFELVYLLLVRGRMTAPELAEHLEVSVRTIYRDIDALSRAGIPVYTLPGRNGGVALMDHYILDRAALSEAEQTQILTALQAVAGDPHLSAGAGTLEKLSALFQRREPDWIQVDLSGWGSPDSPENRLEGLFTSLKDAILQRRVIRFVYAGSDGSTRSRSVLPARLVFKGQTWYLQGLCLERQAYRTFRLSRMSDLQVTSRVFGAPLSPPPLDGPDASQPEKRNLVSVRLRFPPTMAFRVRDEFAASTVDSDGFLETSVTFLEDDWLYHYLLSFGPDVEILEPEHVRQQMIALVKKILEQYENPDRGWQGKRFTMRPSFDKEAPLMNEQQPFCQSCGMPLTDPALRGTEADGSPSLHYCKYCYENGAFRDNMTMEQMIDFCAPIMAKENPGLSEEAAKEQMRQYFPRLLRWQKTEGAERAEGVKV